MMLNDLIPYKTLKMGTNKFKPSRKRVYINNEQYILTNITHIENWSYQIDELKFTFKKCSDKSLLVLSEYDIYKVYNREYQITGFNINIYLK